MHYIDAHVHVWTPDTAHYPLAPGYKKEDMKPPSFTPEERFKHAKPAGVKRTNVKNGALAAFLEACRTGRVPRGSVLIVECLARLSRDQIRPALQVFMAIQDFGITIVTLQPEREYTPDGTDALQLIDPL